MEPLGLFELFLIDDKGAAALFGEESDHDLVWKWPGLTAEVFEIGDLDACLLQRLTFYRGLEGFAWLDKPCDEAVHSGRESRLPCHEDMGAVFDEHDNGGRDFGKIMMVAMGAALCPMSFREDERAPTFAAELVCPIPILDLKCCASCVEFCDLNITVQTS